MHVVQGWENDVPSHAFDCQHEFQYRRRGYRVTNLRLVGDDRDLGQAFAKHFCQSGHFRTITIGCRGRVGVNAVDVFRLQPAASSARCMHKATLSCASRVRWPASELA